MTSVEFTLNLIHHEFMQTCGNLAEKISLVEVVRPRLGAPPQGGQGFMKVLYILGESTCQFTVIILQKQEYFSSALDQSGVSLPPVTFPAQK